MINNCLLCQGYKKSYQCISLNIYNMTLSGLIDLALVINNVSETGLGELKTMHAL